MGRTAAGTGHEMNAPTPVIEGTGRSCPCLCHAQVYAHLWPPLHLPPGAVPCRRCTEAPCDRLPPHHRESPAWTAWWWPGGLP